MTLFLAGIICIVVGALISSVARMMYMEKLCALFFGVLLVGLACVAVSTILTLSKVMV